MNLIDRQTYKDTDIQGARSVGCDLVQLKYDGWWSRIEISEGWVRFYSRTSRLFKEMQLTDRSLRCTLIGEHMQGTQWAQEPGRIGRTFLFDCWSWGDTKLADVSYRDRYRVLRLTPTYLPESFTVVQCFPMTRAEEIWTNYVATSQYEGLVYRRAADDLAATVYRQKQIITEDLVCDGFIEGMGKFAGTLGAIRAHTSDGVIIDVGGGFTDAQRREIWDNQDLYLNKPFEVEARARFESGSLRHPNFVRWRFDK